MREITQKKAQENKNKTIVKPTPEKVNEDELILSGHFSSNSKINILDTKDKSGLELETLSDMLDKLDDFPHKDGN